MFHSRFPFPAALTLFIGIAYGALPSFSQSSSSKLTVRNEWLAGNKSLQEEQFGAAVQHFNVVIATLNRPGFSVPKNEIADAYQNRADAEYALEHWSVAAQDYSRAIQNNPSAAHAYAYRGIALKATGDYSSLVADEEKATSLNPQYASILDDARSTILWRHVLMGFLALGGVVVLMGAIPFVKALIRIGNAEKQSRAQ